MAKAVPETTVGTDWLLDVLHEVVHAHTGQGAACMFLSAEEGCAESELACPAMTGELAAALAAALDDQGLRPAEQREAARFLLPTVPGHEQVVVLPVVWQGRTSGVLVAAADRAPLGRAGLARVMELAGRGLGLVSEAADTAEALELAGAERLRLDGELRATRMFLELQERLVAARTTGEVVHSLADWLDAPVAVQLPNLIVMEAQGEASRELGLSADRSPAEHEVINRAGSNRMTHVLGATGRIPARVVTTIPAADGSCAGFLLAAVGARGRDVTRRAVEVSRGLIAYQMSVRQEIEASVATLRQRLLTDLLDNPAEEQLANRAAKLGHDLSADHVSLAVGFRAPGPGEGAREKLLRLMDNTTKGASTAAGAGLIGPVEDVVLAFVPEPLPAGAAALAHVIHADAAAAGIDVVVGIGPRACGAQRLAESGARARWAARVLRDAEVGATTAIEHIDDLGVYGLLFDHHRASELNEFAMRWLGPLTEYDRRHRSDLVPTLRELFRQRSLTDAAGTLHIHISTLKYRIGRIEAILGRSVEDWDNIFHLELALRVLDVSELLHRPVATPGPI
ncbi:MAG TPA: helix-turn-helix domain-containing protein [Sporichthyaceae bacterium]|nr:helix-turn-helix domain-containing protein [Sporichthyaceae bacterium]